MPAPSIGGAHTPTDPGAGKFWGSDGAGNSAAVSIDPLGSELGSKYETFDRALCTAFSAPQSQVLNGAAVYAPAGVTVTGVKDINAVAAGGTNPTTVRFGIADSTGKILAVSGNYGTGGTNNATTVFAAGTNSIPVFVTGTTKYVTTYSGLYFVCFLVNGTWGTTQPTLGVQSSGNAAAFAADGSSPPRNMGQTSLTDLPAVASSASLATQSNRTYWHSIY